MSKGVRKII